MFENFKTENPIIRKYIESRNTGREFFKKIYDKDLVPISLTNRGGRLLKLIKNGIYLFDSEEDMTIIQEFIINNLKQDGKKVPEIYRDKFGADSDLEAEFLEGLIEYSHTSLFEIVDIDRENFTIHLVDLLDENEPYSYIDLNLSQSTIIGTLIFLRIVELSEFNVSTGCGFPFPPAFKKHYRKEAKKIQRSIKTKNKEARRFITFYFLHKKFGIEFRTSEN